MSFKDRQNIRTQQRLSPDTILMQSSGAQISRSSFDVCLKTTVSPKTDKSPKSHHRTKDSNMIPSTEQNIKFQPKHLIPYIPSHTHAIRMKPIMFVCSRLIREEFISSPSTRPVTCLPIIVDQLLTPRLHHIIPSLLW